MPSYGRNSADPEQGQTARVNICSELTAVIKPQKFSDQLNYYKLLWVNPAS